MSEPLRTEVFSRPDSSKFKEAGRYRLVVVAVSGNKFSSLEEKIKIKK